MRLLILDPEIKDRSDTSESVDILLLVRGRGGFPASVGWGQCSAGAWTVTAGTSATCRCGIDFCGTVLTQMHAATPHTSRPTDTTVAATTAPFPTGRPSSAPGASLAAGASVVLGDGTT